MFYSLRGTLIYLNNTVAAIECGGVGYKCFITSKTYNDLSSQLQNEVFVFTHFSVREDAMDLYGFSTEDEPFEVYKLGNGYLIKAYSTIGQSSWDWLFYIHEDGSLERFEREDGALSPGSLSKIEYVTINNKSYYLLTIIGFSESDGPEDYDYTEYYYLNVN